MINQDQPHDEALVPRPRRPYEKPRITFHEPLEGVAAVCVPPNGKAVAPCIVGSS